MDKNFCHRNWPDEVSNIYKPYHNLAYTGENMEDYAEISDYAKVKGGEASMQRIVAALKSVDEGKSIDEHVDIESVMKYMALQTIVNFPIDTPFSEELSQRTFFMKLLANESYKARYYHYLTVLCNEYIKGGEFAKTLSTIENEIGEIAGTETNAFYTNEQFHKAKQTLQLVLERRASSVLGQINGTIPSTWEGQKSQPQKLINSDDINLQDLGGI